MEVRTSRLFKQQVAELFRYLKVTFGKRIAVSVRDEIKEQLLRLKVFPNMGAVESQLEGEPDEVVRRINELCAEAAGQGKTSRRHPLSTDSWQLPNPGLCSD